MYHATCKLSCNGVGMANQYDQVTYAAGKDGDEGGPELLGLIAAIFGGSLCGGLIVFAALRKRTATSAGPGPAAEMGTSGRASAAGTTSRVKTTYHEQADI